MMQLNKTIIAPASDFHDTLTYSVVSAAASERDPDVLQVEVRIHDEAENPEDDPHYGFELANNHTEQELHRAVHEAIREHFDHERACYYGDSEY